jgi:hypothetical protein
MGATEVGFVPNIDIQMGTRHFEREQNEKNAPNVLFLHKNKTTSHTCFSSKCIVSRNIKYEENIRFPFLYLTMDATESGFVPSIDIQRGTRCFERGQHEKNAPNAWFSGTKNTRKKKYFPFFYMSLWLRQRWDLWRTMMLKKNTKKTSHSYFSGRISHIRSCSARGFWLRHSQY